MSAHRKRTNNRTRRLSILSPREIDSLYALPKFGEQERSVYFHLTPAEEGAVANVRTAAVAVHLILQLAHFKAKQQFFVYDSEMVEVDLRYVIQKFFPGRQDLLTLKPLSKPTLLLQRRTVLDITGYGFCDESARRDLEHKAQRVAKLSNQPLYIFRECLQYLAQCKLVAPGYRFLQEMIGRVVAAERKRITGLLAQALDPATCLILDEFLQSDERLRRLTVLKQEPRDFTYQQLRREVERRKFFYPLFEFARKFLPEAGLSADSVRYYASLVPFYTVYKLQRMAPETTRLYLLCFAYHRFRQINDTLIEAFVHLTNQYERQAKAAAEEEAHRLFNEATEHLKAAGQVLRLFVDDSISADAPFRAVKEQAFALLDRQRCEMVSAYLSNTAFDKAAFEWAYYGSLSAKFKRNLRHLFTDLTFAGRIENAPLLEAVVFLQLLLRGGKIPRQVKPKTFPVAFIPKALARHVFTTLLDQGKKRRRLAVDRYEFLVYRLLRNALEAGDLYVRDSNEFRRFEDDLIGDEQWKNKQSILKEIGAPILMTPIEEILTKFRHDISSKFERVNRRIRDQENEHIKVAGAGDKRRWNLIYPDEEEPVTTAFYSQLPAIGIAELLWFVAHSTGFLSAFTHVLDRYVKHSPDPKEILADIVAMGTNMGLWKMADVAGLSHASLLSTARSFVRLETLNQANDIVSNAIAALPAFRAFDIQGAVHSSSDGQRIETQTRTINARYSPKYFGLQKGVSAYTLIANHVPINAKIIGTHEHESHYVFDLLWNNTTDIKPERHSTDTHGTNQVNFWILHAFGYQFAPRYRDLRKRTQTLVGFKSPKSCADYLIKPSRRVLESLIVKEWPNIQRIMASLSQKAVSQSTIIRKLSSYARQNQTKRALWELENICRTSYLLDFIDDVDLRQSVQKALNRGEAYHRFRRAIAYVNSGKYRVKTEAEQQVWNECSRLIANAIIFYNSMLLSRVCEQKRLAGDQQAVEVLHGMSPVAWQHVNLIGKFEFGASTSGVDMDALAALFNDPKIWQKSLDEGGDENSDL